MNIGIVGLGLIGGSLAKAFKKNPSFSVAGFDRDKNILDFAVISGAVDAPLNDNNLKDCDALFLALPVKAASEWLEVNSPKIDKHTIVMDCCGVKRRICGVGFRLAEKYGFEFAGGHPMAGFHKWGFSNSRDDMFEGACFVVVPKRFDDIKLLEKIKDIVSKAGFSSISVTTAAVHDQIIAFTSQLAHLVSNTYVKSPTALMHKGFSAGSYQDLTRVAWLNPAMWAELFLENSDNMLFEIDSLIESLGKYRDAIARRDVGLLRELLEEGKRRKEEVSGE